VDVANLHRLAITSTVPIESLDRVKLEPQLFDGEAATDSNEDLVQVVLALTHGRKIRQPQFRRREAVPVRSQASKKATKATAAFRVVLSSFSNELGWSAAISFQSIPGRTPIGTRSTGR
jgi:hypothetical protein